ncbi:MAG: phage integrase SAM-like domain-containing protein [Bacteroidaceae bacterium]|nr:phage integrase SAM-like domain-containing protein [Bacteroidaceae bacterium]
MPKVWEQRNNKTFNDKYKDNKEIQKLFGRLEEIRNEIEGQIALGKALKSEDIKLILEDVIFKEAKEEEKRRKEELLKMKLEAEKMTLVKYFQKFYDDAESGRRVTVKGTRYTHGSLTSIKQALNHFLDYEGSLKKKHDFDDVNMDFYNDYLTYLNKHNYRLNTIGKNICWLKAVMSMAETEGYHHSAIYKDKRFKDTRVEADSIYLTKEDLDAIRDVDLTGEQPGYTLARDIFLIGVWTAQRVSDYNNLDSKNVKEYNVRTIEDVPDPENPGKTKAIVVEKTKKVIEIVQKKTGAKVYVPCSTELLQILEKYDYNVPHLTDQKVNEYIKEVAKMAGLDEEIRIEYVKGGQKHVDFVPKWRMVHTHTARRTGATLMYLSGMEIYDIMKITGHTTPLTLKRYIKADELEVVQKMVQKYDYFN